jgi:hypothetical protein
MKVKPAAVAAEPKTRPIFKLLAGLIIVGFVMAFFSTPHVSNTDASDDGPTISVDADKLAFDYKNNEVTADTTYKGKPLIVAGVIDSINKDFQNEIWVGLKTDNQFMPIHAKGLTVAQASGLKKGEVVALICHGDGMIVGSPMLRDCRVPDTRKN